MRVNRNYDVWVGETPSGPADPASPEFLDELNATNPHAAQAVRASVHPARVAPARAKKAVCHIEVNDDDLDALSPIGTTKTPKIKLPMRLVVADQEFLIDSYEIHYDCEGRGCER